MEEQWAGMIQYQTRKLPKSDGRWIILEKAYISNGYRGLFVGFIMMPGAIYMGPIAGVSADQAAEWVTIFFSLNCLSIIFSYAQEIYLIYYTAGAIELSEGRCCWGHWSTDVEPVLHRRQLWVLALRSNSRMVTCNWL